MKRGATDQHYLVEVRGITKSFGPTNVLKGLDFAVASGEVHALLGGNGAGKSTLINIITGGIRRDGGELFYSGKRAVEGSELDDGSTGIAVVHQELALLPHLTVAENIVLPLCRAGAGLFNLEQAYQTAFRALALIDSTFAARSIRRLVGDLTLHERQLIEIARVLNSGARLLLLDEPTANLTVHEAERLFDIIRRLTRENGIGVVFVSHRMREIRQIADVCTIIRDGRSAIARVPLTELTDAQIVELMGQAVSQEVHDPSGGKAIVESATHRRSPGPARALHLVHGEIALEIPAGSILGLAGAPVGPSTLISTLIGDKGHGSWQVSSDGRAYRFGSPREAVLNGVGYVSGDRSAKGLLTSLPIVDNMMCADRIVRRLFLVRRREAIDSATLLKTLKIRAASLWHLPDSLSGGTQQKLLLARWLGQKPRLLVLEEPTRGVDIGTKREIYALIREMSAAGTTIVWWSTENVELLDLCDLILAFDPDGTPTGVLHADAVTEEELAAATGMAA